MVETDNFRAKVAEYDLKAEVQEWPAPRHRMTFRMLGAGMPLVLLPGLASTYRGYAPSLLTLSEKYRTMTFDYPGDHPDDGASLPRISHDNLVDDLLSLLDHLGIGPALLFGLSFGSTISLSALNRVPDRFPRAVLQGAFARRRLLPPERVALAVGRRVKGTTSRLPFHELGLSRNNRSTFSADQPDRWRFYVEENGRTPIAALTHRLDLLDKLDLRPILPQIRHEVRVIHGTADRIVPIKYHDELLKGLPNGHSVLMQGVGHQPHWTHPDELARLADEFFDDWV